MKLNVRKRFGNRLRCEVVGNRAAAQRKRTAGLRVGTAGGEPAVQATRPCLGTDAVRLGGGDFQRANYAASIVPEKARIRSKCRERFFSLYATCDMYCRGGNVSILPGFKAETVNFATCDSAAPVGQKIRISHMHSADCAVETAFGRRADHACRIMSDVTATADRRPDDAALRNLRRDTKGIPCCARCREEGIN